MVRNICYHWSARQKKTHYFRLAPNRKASIHYTNQKSAWFNRTVTVWFIFYLFWPWHVENYGNMYCILLLDNCTAYNIDLTLIPSRIIIIFFPPNVTNRFQPADMRMIAALKVRYRIIILGKLLDIFDTDGGYEEAVIRRAQQPSGCKVLDYDGKSTFTRCNTNPCWYLEWW